MSTEPDAVTQPPSLSRLQSPDCLALSTDQMAAVAEFIEQVGGVDKAREALAALVKLKEAA